SLFCAPVAHPGLHSFPTRRSSDLSGVAFRGERGGGFAVEVPGRLEIHGRLQRVTLSAVAEVTSRGLSVSGTHVVRQRDHGIVPRSEEHTSELQSRVDLVCRLLLEK